MRVFIRVPALLLFALMLAAPAPLLAQRLLGRPAAALDESDRIRLAESFRLADALRERIWPTWNDAPFAVLLVTPEHEMLLRHPAPSADFERIGYDSLLASEVYVRPRTFAPTLLATFPAVGGVPTIVIGQPKHTGKSSSAWVLTVVHEHFHQLQMSHPDYSRKVEALDLTRGDQTGMWMLNYPFPYDSPAVQDHFRTLAHAVAAALEAHGTPAFRERVEEVRTAEMRLRQAVAPADARYLAFQSWQEGVARYTEDQVAQLAAHGYTPGPAFERLPDYTPAAVAADSIRARILSGLRSAALGRDRRGAFYSLGAGIALLLDWAEPDWKARYFEQMFALGLSTTAGPE